MLIFFCALLVISMLGSSAIANPQPLLNNDNPLLTKGYWTLAGTSIEGATQSWTNSWLLDFVIQFKGDPGNWVVRKLDIGRIHRSLKFGPKGSLVEYKAFETKSNVVEPIEDNIPIDKWPERLKDTKWIRSPEIMGNVSDRRHNLKILTQSFTEPVGPSRPLQ